MVDTDPDAKAFITRHELRERGPAAITERCDQWQAEGMTRYQMKNASDGVWLEFWRA